MISLHLAALVALIFAGVVIMLCFLAMCAIEPDDPRVPKWLRDYEHGYDGEFQSVEKKGRS